MLVATSKDLHFYQHAMSQSVIKNKIPNNFLPHSSCAEIMKCSR